MPFPGLKISLFVTTQHPIVWNVLSVATIHFRFGEVAAIHYQPSKIVHQNLFMS